VLAACAVIGLATASTASAHERESGDDHGDGRTHAVFVQTNNVAGNQIAVYDQADDGTLAAAGTYATGGNGGVLVGAVVDTLASQGSLVYDARHHALLAVNAGSDSITVFRVHGDRLDAKQVLPSRGTFPASIAVQGNLVYVLNARDGGSVAGYRFAGSHLVPLANSVRSLGLDATAAPEFLNTPGQVGFSPDGAHLLVTTKGNGHDVLVFAVHHDGRLSASPVVNPQGAGTAPFGFVFDDAGHFVLVLAGTSTTATFDLQADGTLTPVASVADGQRAACWIAGTGNHLYVSNAGSANVSVLDDGPSGLTLVDPAVATDPGTIDAAVSGHHLYVQSGATGIVDIFGIASDGALTPMGSVTVPDAVGFEGIAAT
jgi:DNA-binding beta-propeller fold protein YncE